MSILRRLRSVYFDYFTLPASDRPICQVIRTRGFRKIVEVGIGDGQRALRMIEAAKMAAPAEEIVYVGMDWFEGRSPAEGSGLSLKEAHQLLCNVGVRIRLLPGDPRESLVRAANSLGKVDVLIVPSVGWDESASRTWFFVPRILHEQSLVYVESSFDDGRTALQLKPRAEIERMATPTNRRHAA